MQTLLFGSLNTVIDVESLQRRAFNIAFSTLGLRWHWQANTYERLSKIVGERHRVAWFAEHHEGIRVTCGLADKICWHKELALTQLLERNHVRTRPGVLRLLHEATDAHVETVLQTGGSADEQAILMYARNTLEIFNTLKIQHDEHLHQASALKSQPVRHGTLSQAPRSTVTISLNQQALAHNANFSYAVRCCALSHCKYGPAHQKRRQSLISHLGEPDNPARHLSGLNILQKGIASLRSLSSLDAKETLRQAEPVQSGGFRV